MKPNKLADLILLCKIKPRRATRSKVIQIMSHKCQSLSLGNLDLDCAKELYTGTIYRNANCVLYTGEKCKQTQLYWGGM